MSTGLISPAQGAFTGVTFGVGFFDFLAENSASIAPFAMLLTALAAVVFGFWNAKSNSDRNKINERDVTCGLIRKLELQGKSDEYIEDFKKTLRQ